MKQKRYIATFPAGCYEVVNRQLKQFRVDEIKIIDHDLSSVTFDSDFRKERVIEFRFFTNVFLVLDTSNLSAYQSQIHNQGYRLIALTKGEPTQIEQNKRTRLMQLIETELKLKPNVKNPVDFVLIKRGGEDEVLTLRLPRVKHKREELPNGALRPELAHILLLVAGVKAKDILLDAFAGYGSIPVEATKGFGVKKVIAIEKEAALVRSMIGKGFEVVQDDASELQTIPDASVDKIVTDPPWGIYENRDDLTELYGQFLNAMSRVLKPKGIAVILSGSETLDEIINKNDNFGRLKVLNVLVSGKKANIIKLQKINQTLKR
jgi:predicted RNA methylase